MEHVTIKEMSTIEILEQLESCAQDRLSMSAQCFIRLYQQGNLVCPGEYADMLALVSLLPTTHQIFAADK